MITIKEIKEKDHELCYELDSHTISLWSKKQWVNEFRKEGTKVFGLNLSNVLIAICVIQFVADEAHLNYLSVNYKFQRQGFGSNLMSYVLKQCKTSKLSKVLLEVSSKNVIADIFYDNFNFINVGIREKYYKDGSDALLKEKKLI